MAFGLYAKAPVVNDKVLSVFKKTFTEVENVVWSNTRNIFMVNFTQQGIHTIVKYDADGNFLSSLRYYSADRLPVDVQHKLKNEFTGRTIFIVTEYVVGDNVNYYVKMEDATSWITVKVNNSREMLVVEEFNKL